MEFIPADDEKGPGLRFEAQGQREAGQAGREARQISLSGASQRTMYSSQLHYIPLALPFFHSPFNAAGEAFSVCNLPH